MLIRDLTINDFNEVNEIFMQMQDLHVEHRPDLYRKIDKPTTTKAWDYEASLSDENMIMLGAEVNGSIVGFCISQIQEAKGGSRVPRVSVHIRNIAVDEAHHRCGIGKALYNEAVTRGKARGAAAVDLKVFSFNDDAIAFYRSLGMTVQSYTMEQMI